MIKGGQAFVEPMDGVELCGQGFGDDRPLGGKKNSGIGEDATSDVHGSVDGDGCEHNRRGCASENSFLHYDIASSDDPCHSADLRFLQRPWKS
ncbi:hypothetical protein GCM10011402_37740 [Paracoccus acridae]|uniref:Uncharacterized protein n=1 Tax=Paracoccus acridae TaxID=1795310 RepID=A0ABQ1VPH2_9RHOB|nr:hypothetical protein GCM10011402_37740 [Paracoccus acridae]